MKMNKFEIIEIAKQLAKDYFSECLESINGDFGIIDDDIIILGFREDMLNNKYRIIFMTEKLDEYRCEITYNLSDKGFESNIYKRMII